MRLAFVALPVNLACFETLQQYLSCGISRKSSSFCRVDGMRLVFVALPVNFAFFETIHTLASRVQRPNGFRPSGAQGGAYDCRMSGQARLVDQIWWGERFPQGRRSSKLHLKLHFVVNDHSSPLQKTEFLPTLINKGGCLRWDMSHFSSEIFDFRVLSE